MNGVVHMFANISIVHVKVIKTGATRRIQYYKDRSSKRDLEELKLVLNETFAVPNRGVE